MFKIYVGRTMVIKSLLVQLIYNLTKLEEINGEYIEDSNPIKNWLGLKASTYVLFQLTDPFSFFI